MSDTAAGAADGRGADGTATDGAAADGAPTGGAGADGARPAAASPAPAGSESLLVALSDLRTALRELRLPLELPGVADDRHAARRLVEQLEDFLLPRVRQMGAPLLAVVGGSTGAGKSTLVSSLVGASVTPSGVLRPTTRAPVLVHHPDDAAWFSSDRILPDLPRVTGATATGRALRLVAHPAVPRGLALLDAPDIDSVEAENRRLGEELLGAADLWVFVTTAARYADAVPWDLLTDAARRRAVLAMVLNRVDVATRTAVSADLGRMLTERGLADAPLFAVPEAALVDGLLPSVALTDLSTWLRTVVGDPASRERVVRRTVAGAVADVVARAPGLAAAADAQVADAERLRDVARGAYADAAREVGEATSDGTMLRGEVLARWQEYVGTGELLRAVEARVSTVRDRVGGFLHGRPAPEPVTAAIGSGLVALLVDAADDAAARAHAAWRSDPAGRRLLDAADVSRASPDLRERAAAEVRAWQGSVLQLVSTEGADRRMTARVLSFGVNGLGAALMVAIFASTGGLTLAEVGVAGGAAVLAQRLLEAVFGDDAVRRLTRTAQEDLAARTAALLAAEERRFTTALDALAVPRGAADRLRAAAHEVHVRAGALTGEEPEAPAATPYAAGRHAEAVPEASEATEGALRRWWRQLWE